MASHKNFDLEHDKDGIAWITMDVAGRSVNVLTHSVMDELISIVDGLADKPPVGLVLRSGKERGFIFGADINEFDSLDTRKKIHAHIATVLVCFQKIEDMPCPSVVLVDGICLGGGFELALAFDRIIGIDHPSCQIGFPEINLGLLPGYGGSARSFTRLGVAGALDLVLHGKPMQARKAVEAGAMDELVATRDALKPAAVASIKACIETGKKRPAHTDREGAAAAPSSATPDAADAIQSARKAIEARHIRENTPAPFAIIDHYAMDAPSQAGLIANESELFCDLMPTPASVGLRRTFQLNDLVKKGGARRSGHQARPCDRRRHHGRRHSGGRGHVRFRGDAPGHIGRRDRRRAQKGARALRAPAEIARACREDPGKAHRRCSRRRAWRRRRAYRGGGRGSRDQEKGVRRRRDAHTRRRHSGDQHIGHPA